MHANTAKPWVGVRGSNQIQYEIYLRYNKSHIRSLRYDLHAKRIAYTKTSQNHLWTREEELKYKTLHIRMKKSHGIRRKKLIEYHADVIVNSILITFWRENKS